MSVSLSWKNIVQNKKRTLAAVSGISFSILLVFMQLGFLQGAKTAAAALFNCFDYDVGIVSAKYKFMGAPDKFDRMRITQALTVPEVQKWANLNITRGEWTDPQTEITTQMLIFGFPTDRDFVAEPRMKAGLDSIRKRNTVMVDLYSHGDFGDLSVGREVEVNQKKVTIADQFKLGVSLFADGCIIVNNDNFYRLAPVNSREINYGFLHLERGADPMTVKQRLQQILPDDVLVFTKKEMIRQEQDYFIAIKPVGIIFEVGVIVAFVVGVVILFQVLNTDISSRLDEFATLKAMGFSNFFIYGVGVKQALLYALMSYFPSLLLASLVYKIVHYLSRMPMDMTFLLALFVFAMTLLMCVLSSILGLQKIRKTDPAELY